MELTSAIQLCRDLQRGETSSAELMSETYRRINSVNPQVNALVNVIEEEVAIQEANKCDDVPIADRGPLHGLPMAIKDLIAVKGLPTTMGFVPFADNIASEDDPLVSRLRSAGAIIIGHTNTPEFGLGSHTFNQLFGKTLNPYDLTKTPGGSSGGAAVALATEMLKLADGSDMGGSLRNPASFCNVVGLRPSIGRMPKNRGFGWAARLSTTGPMAKTVADAALLFSIIAGPHDSDPLTLPEAGTTFLDGMIPLNDLKNARIAYSPSLNNLPIDSQVTEIVASAANIFADLGCQVEENQPDLSKAMKVFQTQRALNLKVLGDNLDKSIPNWKTHAKETAIWNINKGKELKTDEIVQAELTRSEIYSEASKFFEDYDALILPAAQVPPFDHEVEWISNIDGCELETYIDWMTICCAITVTGFPAISVPAGFTKTGLPVGLQIVGKPRGDLALLRLAGAFEEATQYYKKRPKICAIDDTK